MLFCENILKNHELLNCSSSHFKNFMAMFSMYFCVQHTKFPASIETKNFKDSFKGKVIVNKLFLICFKKVKKLSS